MDRATREKLRDYKPGEGDERLVLHKQIGGAVNKAVIDEERRIIQFVSSTSAEDRHGDVIEQDGWELENYRSNPVVLWAHMSHKRPIGKNLSARVEGGKLITDTQFIGEDETSGEHFEFVDSVFRMLLGGYLNAKSVGFLPLEWSYMDDWWGPVRFMRQELLEDSVVPVPANPEALMGAKSAGINVAPIARWAGEVLDGLPVEDEHKRRVFEAAYKYAAEHPSFHPVIANIGKACQQRGLILPKSATATGPELLAETLGIFKQHGYILTLIDKSEVGGEQKDSAGVGVPDGDDTTDHTAPDAGGDTGGDDEGDFVLILAD